LFPTSLTLLSPTSEIYGASSNIVFNFTNYEIFGDIFTFTILAGYQVDPILATFTRPNSWAWIGTAGFDAQLGFSTNPASGTLLPQMGIDSPIPSGTYGMYIEHHEQDFSDSSAPYSLSFQVSNVPEPSCASLLLLSSGAFVRRRRTQRPTSGTSV
jgi:hypothetical protein